MSTDSTKVHSQDTPRNALCESSCAHQPASQSAQNTWPKKLSKEMSTCGMVTMKVKFLYVECVGMCVGCMALTRYAKECTLRVIMRPPASQPASQPKILDQKNSQKKCPPVEWLTWRWSFSMWSALECALDAWPTKLNRAQAHKNVAWLQCTLIVRRHN